MKHFKFRCVKITFENKKSIRLSGGEEQHSTENTVSIVFEPAVEPTGPTLNGHGHISLYLDEEQFKELGYSIGQEYVLASMSEALDCAMITE